MKTHPLQIGDILIIETPEIALENMTMLHNYGIETRLYSYFNGNICTALEIIHIPKYKEKGSLEVNLDWIG